MRKHLLFLLGCVLFASSANLLAATKKPVTIVVPFTSSVTLGKNTSTDINLVIQNNAGVNQTITNLVPQIPDGSPISAMITDTNCGFLAPEATCEATARLTGLKASGNGNLNISVCSFNGMACSRINQPITVTNAALTRLFVFPTSPSIANGTTKQFYAIGLYANNTLQNLTTAVTWSSSSPTIATISTSSGQEGLANGVAVGASTITAAMGGLSASSTLTVTAATLTSITVTPVLESIANGTKQQFSAVGIYSDNSHQDITSSVTWSSSNTSIATISNLRGQIGVATGKSVGTTTITATLGAFSGTAALHVTAATLTAISVTPSDLIHAKGTLQQFTATGIYSDNSTEDLTNDVTWNTGSALIAIVSNRTVSKGLGLGVGVGTTTVSATLGSISGSTHFTVTESVLKAINISPTNQTTPAGETQQFTATGIYSDFSTQDLTQSVTWRSSNPQVATISNAPLSQGLATAESAGTVTISAEQAGIVSSTSYTVSSAILTSIDVTPTTPTIAAGTQLQFTATGHYSDGSTNDLTTLVTWESSTPATAVILNVSGSEGLATASAAGLTTISALFENVTGGTNLTVTAATLTSITVTPANSSMPMGTTSQFTAMGTYSDASTQNITRQVTWSSSNTAKATVSNALLSKGLVSGVAQGSTTITASLGGISGNTGLTINSVSIGQILNGGVVACLGGGLNNLITAKTTNSTAIAWGGQGIMTNAQSDVDGGANTRKIVNKLGAGNTYAAGICDAYEIDSAGNSPCIGGNTCYNDWFLPATNQIECMRGNRNQVGGFDRIFYWASTEDSASPTTKAWSINFANSGHPPDSASKDQLYAVRCVRLIS